MGQKVNPHGARVGVIKDWSTQMCIRDRLSSLPEFEAEPQRTP